MTTIQHLVELNSAAILQLSHKVDDLMAAIDDLRLAVADLGTLIDGTITTVTDKAAEAKAVADAQAALDAQIAEQVAAIRALQAKVSPHVTVPAAPAPAPVDTSVPPPPPAAPAPAVVADPVTNMAIPAPTA